MKKYKYTRRDIATKINYYLGSERSELKHHGIPVDFLESLAKDVVSHDCNCVYHSAIEKGEVPNIPEKHQCNCNFCKQVNYGRNPEIQSSQIENMPTKPVSLFYAVDALWDAMDEVINEVNKLKK